MQESKGCRGAPMCAPARGRRRPPPNHFAQSCGEKRKKESIQPEKVCYFKKGEQEMTGLLKHRFQLLTAFALLACATGCAQQPQGAPEAPKTKLEAFGKQTGAVFIKGFSKVGSIFGLGTASVTCMEFTNASTGVRQMGIVIEVTESGRFESSDRSFIDYDEIEPLLKGIEYISKVTSASTKLAKFEAIYKTKGDFSVTTFSSAAGGIEAAVKSGYIGAATAFISIPMLNDLRNFISQAKQTLDSIK